MIERVEVFESQVFSNVWVDGLRDEAKEAATNWVTQVVRRREILGGVTDELSEHLTKKISDVLPKCNSEHCRMKVRAIVGDAPPDELGGLALNCPAELFYNEGDALKDEERCKSHHEGIGPNLGSWLVRTNAEVERQLDRQSNAQFEMNQASRELDELL